MDKFINEIDLGKLNLESIDNKKYEEVLLEVSRVDGFRDYLKETLALDIKRYFFMSTESQSMVKGAYLRTLSLYNLLSKISEEQTKKLTK